MTLNTKRVYDRPEKTDGRRILVDRLWPRGLAKEKEAEMSVGKDKTVEISCTKEKRYYS